MGSTPVKPVGALRSEDDVRTKVVVPWLLSCGFSLATLSIEFGFRIRIGRSVMRVGRGTTSSEALSKQSARADVLVRNERSENLLIVEVKAPDEVLDDAARDQAISYARCVEQGNIAPFVVVTNGHVSRVYDSFTRLEFLDSHKLGAACEASRSFVPLDELALRAEALEALISFSQENLLAFCDAQTRFRMKPLFGEKLDSDKKYIPSLYVQRGEVASQLSEALDEKGHRVTLLIGHPQVGKTNIVCHTVLERLSSKQPCLFYPAISLQKPLLAEIGDDFEWVFSTAQDSYGQLVRKLNRVLQRANKRLVIFVDGLNETSVQLARAVDSDCSRLSSDRIQIVISLTHSSATRILRDAAGNSSFIAGEAGIPSHGANLIELDPEAAAKTSGWNCIHVRRYSRDERDRAYDVYARAYGVDVPGSHEKTQDPYVLGIAMKQFAGERLPDSLDEPTLLHSFIVNKTARAIGLDSYNIPLCLRELGREMLRSGAPVPVEALGKIWQHPIAQKVPSGFFESALLIADSDDIGQQSVDFYYGRERDYVISCMAGHWPQKLSRHKDMDSEFSDAVTSAAGNDALSWFFRQPAHVALLARQTGGIPNYSNPRVRQTLLSALCEYTSAGGASTGDVLRFAINSAMNDTDHFARIEAIKCVALGSDDSDDLTAILKSYANASLEEFVEVILGIGEEFPLRAEDAGQVVLDALRSLHWDIGNPDKGTSEITEILIDLTNDPRSAIRREANTCLGYISAHEFVNNLSELINQRSAHVRSDNLEEFSEAIKNAGHGLSYYYYGDLCRGYLDAILEDPEYQAAEYLKMKKCLEPIIHIFGDAERTDIFRSILVSLRSGLIETAAVTADVAYIDIYTLPLPFEEKDDLS